MDDILVRKRGLVGWAELVSEILIIQPGQLIKGEF